jgi:hypothetical protein
LRLTIVVADITLVRHTVAVRIGIIVIEAGAEIQIIADAILIGIT